MSEPIIYDPYDHLPFQGYIDPSTGVPERFLSLAHFYFCERLRGVDDQYRAYVRSLDDPEIFALEADGLLGMPAGRTNWKVLEEKVMYAGVYMQAAANRDVFAELIECRDEVEIEERPISDLAGNAMLQFIDDLMDTETPKLKVAFLGGGVNATFAESCMNVIFAKSHPQCLYAIEQGREGAVLVSAYAQRIGAAFTAIDAQDPAAAANHLLRRCSHIFMFDSPSAPAYLSDISAALEAAGKAIKHLRP